jgi:hypothetical protein
MLEPFVLEKLGTSELVVNAVVVSSQLLLLPLAMYSRMKWLVTAALTSLVAIHLSFIPLDFLHRHGVW